MVDINDEMWYTNGTKYDSGIENTPSSQGRVRRAVVNRLVNADFSSGWTQTKEYGSDTYSIDSSVTCLAMRSAKLIKRGAGEFKSTSQAKLFKSGNYTFSAYVKTTGLTVPDGKKGAFLRVTDGANVYESEGIKDTTAARDFTYVKNFQGDIVGILDASGNLVVEYKYDAWGDAVSIYSASTTVDSLAFDNPFRYRGYVWDEETRLYYLRSRYYNPEIYRFLNVDIIVKARSSYTYCANSPVIMSDTSGNEETPNDSVNYLSDFSNEGFICRIVKHPIGYNAKTRRYEQKDIITMYIPHQDVQAYINALYFADDDISKVLEQYVLETSVEKVTTMFFDLMGGYSKVFNGMMGMINILGVMKEYEEANEAKKVKEELYTEGNKAKANKTGLYVYVEKTNWWVYNDAFIATHYKPDATDFTIKYRAIEN